MSADRPVARLRSICLDGADAEELATFYQALLGWRVTARDGRDWIQLRSPDDSIGLNLQAEDWYRPPTWPERDDGQDKMMHLEVEVDDLQAAVEAVIANGGREASHQPPDRDQNRIRVVLDPAGHPFCLFTSGE